GEGVTLGPDTVVHVTRGGHNTQIGDGVVIGSHAIIHACNIGAGAVIGDGVVVMDDAVLGKDSLLLSGSVLPPGKKIPDGEVWGGNPARKKDMDVEAALRAGEEIRDRVKESVSKLPAPVTRDNKTIISEKAFVAPNAVLAGPIAIAEEVGVWFACVLDAMLAPISIGARTNVQDGTVVRGLEQYPCRIGAGVTIGHRAVLEGCIVEDDAFIGMGAVLPKGVVVRRGGWVAAGAVLPENTEVSTGEIWAGNPAALFRPIKAEEAAFIPVSAANYAVHVPEYLGIFPRI
ncbi:MAG: hypothetical protein J0L97_03420, partial [Alphaproteobacteria bacterium]|nr:hypothetical protein [Alphaproteobacteria bacterium]